jgi:hypothetical protein
MSVMLTLQSDEQLLGEKRRKEREKSTFIIAPSQLNVI